MDREVERENEKDNKVVANKVQNPLPGFKAALLDPRKHTAEAAVARKEKKGGRSEKTPGRKIERTHLPTPPPKKKLSLVHTPDAPHKSLGNE